MGDIFMLDNEELKILEEKPFQWESNLQDILEENPSLLAVEEVSEESQLVTIGREVSFEPGGSADLLYIDEQGILTVIETKLAKNAEIQREVIGQILEYASSIVRWEYEDIEAQFHGYISENQSSEINSDLYAYLQSNIKDFEFEDVEDFSKLVEDNLKDGSMRLIVVVDKIVDRLRRLVTFLNEFTSFEIFILQISQYEDSGDRKVYVPKLFGYKPESKKPSSRRKYWDESSFLKDAEARLDSRDLKKIKSLLEFSKQKADEITWGTGIKKGSFNPKFYIVGSHSPYHVYSNGRISLYFIEVWNTGINESRMKSFRQKIEDEIQGIQKSKKSMYFYISDVSSEDLKFFKEQVLDLIKSYEKHQEELR